MADALVAFPLAYYMAKHASPKMKTWLVYCSYTSIVVELSGESVRMEADPSQGRHHLMVCEPAWFGWGLELVASSARDWWIITLTIPHRHVHRFYLHLATLHDLTYPDSLGTCSKIIHGSLR